MKMMMKGINDGLKVMLSRTHLVDFAVLLIC